MKHALLFAMFGIVISPLLLNGCFESNSEDPPAPLTAPGGGNNGGGGNSGISAVDDTLDIVPNSTGTVNILRNDSSVDNITLTQFDSVSVKGGAVSDNGDGTLNYTPAADYSGDDSFSYEISNDVGAKDTAVVKVFIGDSVRTDGQSYYVANCAICHAAGDDDTTQAFYSKDLRGSSATLQPDITGLGGTYELMGNFSNVPQREIDRLKAYIAGL